MDVRQVSAAAQQQAERRARVAMPPISIRRLWSPRGPACSVRLRPGRRQAPSAAWSPADAGRVRGAGGVAARCSSRAGCGRCRGRRPRVAGSACWPIVRDGPRLGRAPGIGHALDPARLDECVDDLGVELDAGELAQLRDRLLRRQRRHPVGPGGRHRLERVGHVQDPGQQRDLVADQAVRVARPVVPLVVVADDRQLARQPLDLLDDLPRPGPGARSSSSALPWSGDSCLRRTCVRHADLADVVEEAAPLEGLEVRLAQPHHPPDARLRCP